MKQLLKQKIAYFFVTLAFLSMFAQIEIPHHHHGNLVCFSQSCLESCGCHDEHSSTTYADNTTEYSCTHHAHSHDACTLYAPFIVGDNLRDLCNKILIDSVCESMEWIEVQFLMVHDEAEVQPNFAPPIVDYPPPICRPRNFRAPPAV